MQDNEPKSEPVAEETVQPEADATVEGEKIEAPAATSEAPAAEDTGGDQQD